MKCALGNLVMLRLSAACAATAEVSVGTAVLVTPRVPGIHPLHKLSDVIVVRHASNSTRLPTARHHLARLIVEIEIAERLPVSVAHDKARGLLDGPRRDHLMKV